MTNGHFYVIITFFDLNFTYLKFFSYNSYHYYNYKKGNLMKSQNPLLKFIIILFIVSIVSIIIWIIAIQIYQANKIKNSINKFIEKETILFSKNINSNNLEKLKKDIQNNPLIISIEIYNNKKQKILDIKKDKYPLLVKDITLFSKNFSKNTRYKLIPINKKNVYIYIQTSTKIKNKTYYINLLSKFDDETLLIINKDIKSTIIVILSTIFVIYLTVFPLIYSEYKKLLLEREKITHGNINTLIALGDAIAQKDNETSEHNYRVTYYSIELAKQLNLKFEQIQTLIKGAFLHDIGKIGIPDAILLKPAKLNDDEFEIMKTHVLKGAEIVDNNFLIEDAKDVVLYHHEKYDGTGYMAGLKGENIPFNARLFAVIDVFDALTSKRPYKEPFSVEKSISIIKNDSGTHFDPKIVEEFEKIAKKLYDEIYHLSLDELKNKFHIIVKPYFDIKG